MKTLDPGGKGGEVLRAAATEAKDVDDDEVTNLTAIYWNVSALDSAPASCLSRPQAKLARLFVESTTTRIWKVIPANSSYGGALSIVVFKIVTKMVHHYDQDEGQSDAALPWDATGASTAESVRKT